MAIPVRQDRSGEPDEAQSLAALLPIGAELKARVRILIVDDEHTLRESCASVLRQEGYDVTVSGRGQEALDLLKRRAFDISPPTCICRKSAGWPCCARRSRRIATPSSS